jgi:hypothetical protein
MLLVDRLDQEADRAIGGGLLAGVGVAAAGQEHERHRTGRVQLLGQFQAVHAGHVNVQQGQVGLALGDRLQGLLGGRRFQDVVAGVAEHLAEEVEQQLIVVDDEYQTLRAGRYIHVAATLGLS